MRAPQRACLLCPQHAARAVGGTAKALECLRLLLKLAPVRFREIQAVELSVLLSPERAAIGSQQPAVACKAVCFAALRQP